jgi:membrane fusion protein, multidrug efflux system
MFENERDRRKKTAISQEVMKMIRRHPVVSVFVVVLVLGALAFVLVPTLATSKATREKAKQEEKQEKKEDKKLPVEVAVAKKGPISSFIVTTATLEPDSQVTILSETTGTVQNLMVDEGSFVKEGQTLAVFADNQKMVDVQKAEIRLQNSKVELQRKESSYQQKIISQADYDKAKFERDVAESELKASTVASQRLTIHAPFSGIITQRFIEKGQNIAIGAQLFTLLDKDPLKARIYLPEKEIFGIEKNQQVSLTLNAQKDVKFTGKIDQINPAVDTKTGTVKVTIIIDSAPQSVRPGSFVDVRLVTQRHDNALLIPKRALVEEAGEKYVFLLNKDMVVRRTVRVGFTDDVNAEILSGVEPGNSVVTAGQGSLRDGSRAEVVENR